MTNFEMVEMLREKANISYEEAKAALEAANWDLLDAMVILEKEGKVVENGGSYSTRPEEEEPQADKKKEKHLGDAGVRSACKWIWDTFCKLVRMGNANFFVVSRKDSELFSLPVTVFVVLLILSQWVGLIALVVGLFCGVRYSFRGPNLGKQAINDAMGKAADVAENVKDEIRSAAQNAEKEKQENGDDGEN